MAEGSAKDVVPNVTSAGGSEKIVLGGSSSGKEPMAENVVGISKWKKRADALFYLDDLQEKAGNQISSSMTFFVQRTHIVKEVCSRRTSGSILLRVLVVAIKESKMASPRLLPSP
jgi:hypothetical protein